MSSPCVIHVLAGTGFGGAERVASTLAQRAIKSGWDVTLECAPQVRAGIAEYSLETRSAEATLWAWSRAARSRIKALAPDVAHVHLSTPSLLSYALLAIGQRPALITFHLLPQARWPRDRLTRLPSRWLVRLAQRTHRTLWFNTVSQTDAAVLSQVIPEHRLRAILNAPPLDVTGEHAEAAVWSGSGTRVLAVGRLVPQKGFDRLLTALSSPHMGQTDWQLVVVGAGPEQARLERMAKALGLERRVSWRGAVPSAPWLAGADLVVSPSRFEGMPLVPLEAIRAGVPILASTIAPHVELFGARAPLALLPEDERLWPQNLQEYVSNPKARQRLGDEQHGLYALCDPNRQWQDYLELYGTIINSHARPAAPPR